MNKPRNDRKKRLKLPDWTPGWLRNLLQIGLRIGGICTILFLIVSLYYYYLASQYDLDKVAEITQPNLILAADGSELAVLGAESRRLIKYSELPPHLIEALLAREDTRFQDHIGIDLKGLARATLKNITTMSYQEGASTISMQLTKNTFDNKSKSIHRKFLEIAITLRLESKYDKDEILTHYLNCIYFGSGCHGIEEAANTYFGVPTSQLTLGQSALLVGIIRGPHIFSPFNNLEKAIAQRDQVLDRMLDIEQISSQQRDDAKSAPLKLIGNNTRKSTASYAVTSILRHQQQIIDTTEIAEGGLRITSTINKKLTSIITADLKKLTSSINQNNDTPIQVAVVVLENKTGAIRAIIGGSDYLKYPYNRAFDSKQELGDALTPFIYLATLDRGKIPLKDQPIITGQQIGAEDLLGYCTRFGITHMPSENTNDLYRGSIYASPLELANAYAIIQNEGIRAESYLVENISNNSGTELFTQDRYQQETVSTGAALNCLNMLTKNIAGKRTIQQTAYAYKHAWIITSTKTHTAVIWIGHDLPKDIPNKTTLTKSLTEKVQPWLKSINQAL
ncbi:MAG: penicillin-binding protein 1A [Rubritalea sp.]|jgi:penicillin-binding protein 1A